jgi:tetratricopeptide (TPR) repeat protein
VHTSNRLAEAESLYRRALAIDKAVYGPLHPEVAVCLNNLAGLLRVTNRLAEAEFLLWRALDINEVAYGPMHSEVAICLNNLAELLRVTNCLAEAESLLQRMMSIFKYFNDSTGHEHPHWQAALANYSGLLQDMGLSQEDIKRRLQDVTDHPASL